MPSSTGDVTQLLIDWSGGDQTALEKLMPIVYGELRRLASNYLRKERQGHTLQTSDLVNEAYLRLVDYKNLEWRNRAQFFAVAAQAMRRILVDYARKRRYAKRGGGTLAVPLDDSAVLSRERSADLVALDDALNTLASVDPRKSRIVELRFFAGLNIEETAEVLGVSPGTVMRDWTIAKGWLYREMLRS
ncbi:MAG: sigma-70 family RNA polymerase sigma factor [Blastocatellia bacterium]